MVARHVAVLVDDRNGAQRVPLTNFKVCKVVRRGDLESACPDSHVDSRIGDDGDGPVGHGNEDALAKKLRFK